MRPLPGIVIKRGADLTIRLQTGARVRVPRQKDLRLGDAAFVCYDYTKMVVREVWSEDKYLSLEDTGSEEVDFPLHPDYEKPHKWAVDPEVCPVVSL
jgi:hypothetical protein